MNSSIRDLRGVLISVQGGRLLLPNATVAEVITYSDPEPVAHAPQWLLGRVRWRGWALPLLSFSRLAGWAPERGELGAKVTVLKLFGGNPRLPYFALLTQGFPRLVTVSDTALVEQHDIGELPLGALSRVMLNDDAAVVPDLASIELMLADALQRSVQAA